MTRHMLEQSKLSKQNPTTDVPESPLLQIAFWCRASRSCECCRISTIRHRWLTMTSKRSSAWFWGDVNRFT